MLKALMPVNSVCYCNIGCGHQPRNCNSTLNIDSVSTRWNGCQVLIYTFVWEEEVIDLLLTNVRALTEEF